MGCVASNPLAAGWRVDLGEPARPGPQIRGGVSGVITGFQLGLGVDADVPGYKWGGGTERAGPPRWMSGHLLSWFTGGQAGLVRQLGRAARQGRAATETILGAGEAHVLFPHSRGFWAPL